MSNMLLAVFADFLLVIVRCRPAWVNHKPQLPKLPSTKLGRAMNFNFLLFCITVITRETATEFQGKKQGEGTQINRRLDLRPLGTKHRTTHKSVMLEPWKWKY